MTPLQIIERIRTEDFLLDIDSLPDPVKRGARSLQTKLNNALMLLSADLYSNQSHFILELVQNADDNHYRTGVIPQLTLDITPTRLVVVNNEIGFTEANVRAICSVGESSKSKEKSGYIGEKGIGFKSVFTVSDSPEIHSNGFHFKFDRTDENNLLGFVVPHWCEPPSDIDPHSTTIILPAARNYEFESENFVGIDACLLLFLNKLRNLTIKLKGQQVSFQRKDIEALSTLTTTSQIKEGEALSEENHYIRAELTFSMEDFGDEKRDGIKQSKVIIAFPVDEKGAAKPDHRSNVFAFLPIRQMGFKFAIQADFILSSSREEILTDRPWNKALLNGISSVFSSAVEIFRKTEALAFSYLQYIPEKVEVVDESFRTIRGDIIKKLAATESLLSASGKWKKPSELRIADRNFRKVFSSRLAKEIFGFDYVDSRIQGGNDLLRSMGAMDVGLPEVLHVFSDHGEWLKNQSLDWRAKFYAYLADNLNKFVEGGLLKCPCLPISDGSYVVPEQSNVFFPLSKKKKYGFESELVIVDNKLFEEAQKYSEHIDDLFAAMRVCSDEPYDLVVSHILPRHRGDRWKDSNHEALKGHLRYIKDKFNEYLKTALKKGKSESQAVQLLRDGLWIGTKKWENKSWWFSRISSLYLSKEYKPQFCIETLLDGEVAAVNLVSSDYLDTKHNDHDAEMVSWCEFLAKIGIQLKPAIQTFDGYNWKCSDELRHLLDSKNSTVRKVTLECISMYWSFYGEYMTYKTRSGRFPLKEGDTEFAKSLMSTQAPTKKRAKVPLSETYYPTTELKEILGDSLVYVEANLTEAMRDACHISHKVDAKAMIKRLEQLKEEGDATLKQVKAIYRILDVKLWSSDSEFIKQAFIEKGLIQVKGNKNGWFKPSEVIWKSTNSSFLDDQYPPIESLYEDFSNFFVKKLEVSKELRTEEWVNSLMRLRMIENSDNRKSEALSIYLHVNRALSPRFGREVQAPDWVEIFKREEVFINQHGELMSNDGYLLANDSQSIASLFEDEEGLSFLAVPVEDVPRLKRLLEIAGVPLLLDSITIDISSPDSGVLDSKLTERVHRSVNYFARVFYSKEGGAFEQALENGKFKFLRNIEIFEVPQINMIVSIGDYSRVTLADIAMNKNRHVLYRIGARSIKDLLASELSRYLSGSMDMADTFARILMENTDEDIEDFLTVRGIGNLPSDLHDKLHTSDTSKNEDGYLSATMNISCEQPDAEFGILSEGENLIGENDLNNFSKSNTDTPLATSSFPSKDFKSFDGTHDPSLKSIRSKSLSRPTSIAPNTPSSGEIEKNFGDSATGNYPDTVGGDEAATNISDSLSGALDSFSTDHETEKKNSNSQIMENLSLKHRGRPKRLLSYVLGPGDGDQPISLEDPEKIADREAVSRAAIEFFMNNQSGRWKSLIEMPHNNPGFDIQAVTDDNQEEFVEVKGLSGPWTEEGIALTPTELMTAQQKREGYWLCIVEFAQDEIHRQMYLIQDPYGLAQQFRFDVGWKSVAESFEIKVLVPKENMFIDIPDFGRGQILSVHKNGLFFKLQVILEDGRQIEKLFNPVKMQLSMEPIWLE